MWDGAIPEFVRQTPKLTWRFFLRKVETFYIAAVKMLGMMRHENEMAVFEIADRIFYLSFRENIVLDLPTAELVTETRLRMQRERYFCVCYDLSGITDSDKAGRDYLALHAAVLTSAAAIYAHRSVPLIIARFVLKISRPPVPARIFYDKASAIEFLKHHQ